MALTRATADAEKRLQNSYPHPPFASERAWVAVSLCVDASTDSPRRYIQACVIGNFLTPPRLSVSVTQEAWSPGVT
jgi:hypothetical protein